MSARPLSNYEVESFLSRHTEIRRAVAEHEAEFGYNGWRQYDQILATQEEGWLPIPPRGLATADTSFGNVVVFPDAKGILHYVATDNRALIAEVNKPAYQSDPDYWQMFDAIAAKYKEFATAGAGVIEAVAVIALLILAASFLPHSRS